MEKSFAIRKFGIRIMKEPRGPRLTQTEKGYCISLLSTSKFSINFVLVGRYVYSESSSVEVVGMYVCMCVCVCVCVKIMTLNISLNLS